MKPQPTVADALDVLGWLEHALRPLGHAAPHAQVGHAVSNGFAGLLALHGLWTHGTPFVLTEHGVYLRERYMEFRRSAYSPGFKGLLLRFYRLLCSLVYREATLEDAEIRAFLEAANPDALRAMEDCFQALEAAGLWQSRSNSRAAGVI